MSASYENGEEPKQLEATAHKGGTNDVFDIERLRIRQDFTASLVAQRILSTVPVRKPPKQQFVRVHPDPSWQLRTAVLHLKEEGEMYLVDPSLWRDLADEIVPHILFTAVNRQGTYFIWPVRLPREDGRMDEWAHSALAAAKLAMKDWVRVVPNTNLGAYEANLAMAPLPEPEWPNVSFQEIMKIAFKDRFIQTKDHPVLRQLRGEG